MTRKNPDMREHKRRSKAKQAEESRRRRTASVVKDGIPYRTAAETRRSIAYVQYWVGRLLLQIGWRRVGRRRKRGYGFRMGAGRPVSGRTPALPGESSEEGCGRGEDRGASVSAPTALGRRGAVEREGTGEKELRNVLQGTPRRTLADRPCASG